MNSPHSPHERLREAIVLVAGRGMRLRPLTANCPKCLLEVGGQPLLRRLLGQLQAVGIERVILATGYLHDRVMDHVERWNLSLAVRAARNDDYEQSNNAVSLKLAMEALSEPRFLLCDGDVLLRCNSPLKKLLMSPRENVLSLMRFESMGTEEMKVVVDEENARIQELGKALSPTDADGESLGIQKIGPSAFSSLVKRLIELDDRERRELYYEDVFAELIERGIDFYGCELPIGDWTEIDTPDDLDQARQMAQSWSE